MSNAARALFGRGEARGVLDNLDGVSDFGQPQSWLLNFLGLPSKSGAAVSHVTALNLPIVYRCVDFLSATIATMPLKLYRRTANGRDEVRDDPLWDLVHVSPDGFHTAFEWKRQMQGAISLRSNGYSRVFRNTYYEVQSIRPLNPDFVSIWPRADGGAVFRYRDENIPSEDIIHIKGLTNNGWVGLSPVVLGREAIGLGLTLEEFASRFFSNGAAPGGILISPKSLTQDQVDNLAAQWDERHRGVGASNRPAVVWGGIDWKPIGVNAEQAQLLGVREFQDTEIAMIFGIPSVLIKDTSKVSSWGSGIQQIVQGFVKFTLSPIARNWEEKLNLVLLTQKQRASGLYFRFDFDSLLRGDEAARAAFYQVMRNIAAMSVNEIREKEHLNELPDHIGGNFQLPFNGSGGATKPQEGDSEPAAAGGKSEGNEQ